MAHVLLVDDHPALRSALERYLRIQEHAVVAVASAEAALQEIERRRTDVLVTDFKMPRMGGIELVGALRERGILVPVILMSGHDLRPDEAPGAAYLLRKPFGPADLCNAIERVLEIGSAEEGVAGA